VDLGVRFGLLKIPGRPEQRADAIEGLAALGAVRSSSRRPIAPARPSH